MRRYLTLASLLCVFAPLMVIGAGAHEMYDVWERGFTCAGDYDNPYTDCTMSATFKHAESGETMRVDGFWDGGDRFVVRFAPPRPGTWSFTTVSEDAGLDGKSGTIAVSRGDKHGFVVVDPDNPHHFAYSDGTPFYYAATNLSCFSGLSGVGLDGEYPAAGAALFKGGPFQKVVDTRAEQGFTVLYSAGGLLCKPFFNRREQTNEGGPPFFDYDPQRLNPDFFRWVDRRIEYANSRGMVVTVGLGWPDQNILRLGKENLRRMWRYVIARYAAYDTIWNIFGEFEEFGENAVSLANEFGELTEQCDPYGHPTTTHTVDSNNELAGEDWLDFIEQQNRRYEMITEDRRYGKPVVNAEFYYENQTARETGWAHIVNDINLIRKGAWEITARGGMFVYEIWGIERDLDRLLETEGTRQIMYLHELMSGLPYWRLEAIPGAADRGYCLGDAAGPLLVYLPVGGTLRLAVPEEMHRPRARWFDPRNGEFVAAPWPQAGTEARFIAPDTMDWVLLVDEAPEGATAPEVTVPVPRVPDVQPARTQDGLLALYRFEEEREAGLQARGDLKIEDGRVRFTDGSLMTDGAATEMIGAIQNSGEFTVEAWLQTDNLDQHGPARIVSISKDPSCRNMTLGQEGDRIVLRVRHQMTGRNGVPALDPRTKVLDGTLQHIAFTWSKDRACLYADGLPLATWPHGDRQFDSWDDYPLVLGNEATSDRPWQGTLHLVALYDRALSAEEVAAAFRAGPQ